MAKTENKSATLKASPKRLRAKASRAAADSERPPESAENFEHVLRRLLSSRERRPSERGA